MENLDQNNCDLSEIDEKSEIDENTEISKNVGLTEMDRKNEEITKHNEKVSRIRNNSFENNLTEIKNHLIKKYKELLPPYTKEEVDKWSFVHLIPNDLYLYLTNISRRIYIHDDYRNNYSYNNLTITEKTFDQQQGDIDENDDPDLNDSEQIRYNIERYNTILKTQLQISRYYYDDSRDDKYYISPDNIVTCVDCDNTYDNDYRYRFNVLSSFTDFLYDNIGFKYRKLYTEDTYISDLEIYAINYNFMMMTFFGKSYSDLTYKS